MTEDDFDPYRVYTSKPTLGVMPKCIWLTQRGVELSRAIGERLASTAFQAERDLPVVQAWADELQEVLKLAKP